MNRQLAAGLLKALGHPTRLTIVMGLLKNNGECNVNAMVEKLGGSQPNISQHLTILRTAGIIEGYKKGQSICYRVVCEKAEALVRCIEPDFEKKKLF